MTESDIQLRIANDYGSKYTAIPNVNFAWQVGTYYPTKEQLRANKRYQAERWYSAATHEADLLLVGEDFIQEVEIKISFSDFMRDFQKVEHHLTRYTKYVWFAFPEELWWKEQARILKEIQENFPEAGIIIAYEDKKLHHWRWTKAVKRPKKFPAEQLPQENRTHLLFCGVQKWWRNRL